MKFIERTLFATVQRALQTFPAVAITGPRQSGKTTLLRMKWEKTHRFLSLEDPDVRARAITDPKGFLKYNPPPLILDEIQYAPQLLSYIKTAIDEDRTPGRWLFSGSQVLSLMQNVSESMAGRVAVLSLLPFSYTEATEKVLAEETIDAILLRICGNRQESFPFIKQGADYTLGNWLFYGTFPEVRANPKVDRQLWYASYVQTYLERDVRSLLQVGDLNAFERFLKLCAARTAQILNLSDLARDVGITVPTAKKWLSILEASYTVFLLQPYFKNYGKRLIKAPKLYFIDTGLVAFLTGLYNEEAVLHGPLAGALMETTVISDLRKTFFHYGEIPSMYYWRSRDGLEVDLVIERNNNIFPLEIKLTSTVVPQHAGNILKWFGLQKAKNMKGVIIADVDKAMNVANGILAVPWKWV